MPDSKPTQTARGWLQTGQAPKDRVTEVARAAALLSGQVPPIAAALTPPLQPDVEMALLVEGDARGMLGLIDLLAECATHKPVAKHARKLLFRAKQRGLVVPERVQTRAPVSLAARPEPLPSLASTFDSDGNQLLMLGGWSAAEGSWCLAGFVQESEGLHSAYFMPHLSRTAHREIVDKMRGSFGGEVLEVSADFVAGRLRWGADRRDLRQTGWEGDQADTRRVLASAEPLGEIEFNLHADDEPVLAAYLADDAVAHPMTVALIAGRSFRRAALQALAAARKQARESGDGEALRVAGEAWLTEWFAQERRTDLAGRLEIEAWIRHQLSQHTEMMQALALAKLMRDLAQPVLEVPQFAVAARRQLAEAELSRWETELGGAR